MDYGNNWQIIKRLTLSGSLLGLGLGLFCLGLIALEGRWDGPLVVLLPLLFLIPVLGMVVPVMLFRCVSARRNGDTVEYVFLWLFVLRTCPVARFERVERSDLLGPIVVFEDGRRMQLVGMNDDDQRRMEQDLRTASAEAREVEALGCAPPPRPVTIDPCWLAWRDGVIPALARAIHDEQDFERLPILADALEDAGCTDEELLAHCRRQPAVHHRDCWVVGRILNEKKRLPVRAK